MLFIQRFKDLSFKIKYLRGGFGEEAWRWCHYSFRDFPRCRKSSIGGSSGGNDHSRDRIPWRWWWWRNILVFLVVVIDKSRSERGSITGGF
jgi:hypothetical protein